jgi:VanZ family protein
MKIKWLALLFLLFVLAVILATDSGHLPLPVRILYDFPNGDKAGHFLIYGLLAFLLAAAFPRPVSWGRLSIPIVILVLMVFIATEEYSQRFFATRTADFIDLICSWAGCLAGSWAAKSATHLAISSRCAAEREAPRSVADHGPDVLCRGRVKVRGTYMLRTAICFMCARMPMKPFRRWWLMASCRFICR